MTEPKHDAIGPQGTTGEDLAEDLNATTSESAGAATTRPPESKDSDFDIIFDPEQPDD